VRDTRLGVHRYTYNDYRQRLAAPHADITAKCRGDAQVAERKPPVTVEMVLADLLRWTYLY
jgi:hypothetical protein